MTIVDFSGMVHNANQIIDRILDRSVMVVGDDLCEVESGWHFDSVAEFLLAELAVGEALDLQDQDLREAIEIEFALALLES